MPVVTQVAEDLPSSGAMPACFLLSSITPLTAFEGVSLARRCRKSPLAAMSTGAQCSAETLAIVKKSSEIARQLLQILSPRYS